METDHAHIAQYLSDPKFIRLAGKDLNDPEWRDYELANWEDRAVLTQARFVLEASGRFPKQTLDRAEKERIWQGVRDKMDRTTTGSGYLFRNTVFSWASAAAILLVFFGLGWYWFPAAPAAVEENIPNRTVEVFNEDRSVYPVELPDGSTVLLAGGSKLKYNSTEFLEGGKRDVLLYGEAFFEVVPNPDVPFYVYANGLVTKVLGTSFNVKAFPDAPTVEVLVKTGRVSVFTSDNENQLLSEQKGEVLNPDERVVLDVVSRLLSVDKSSGSTVGESPTYSYDDVPVPAVLEELQNQYQIRIVYPNDILQNCKITADLSDEPLYEKIRLICRGLGATYNVSEGTIYIQTEGCI